MAFTSLPSPTSEDIEELLLIARYGELDELKSFIEKFGTKPLIKARDEDGNSVLHMVCGNGHLDLLDYLVPNYIPPSLATVQNSSAGSTPLHWATLNKQLDVVKQLVKLCGALGPSVLDVKNKSGRSAITGAEMNEWTEGVTWMVGVMSVDDSGDTAQETDEVVESEDVQVEIQDAEGRIAKLSVKDGQVEEIKNDSAFSSSPST
ncbi:ankyrin [Thelephora ganbajun]|uniref:Ankyrin n=1 Tax=Thelephora ganbajun TaxID=370292 RepID=A0ACB6ZIW2_THEGA|nr:ankyrin [Thelephora ganbajun]